MYFREKVPLREIARRTGLSRNTVRNWLRQTDAVEPKYPKRVSPSVVDDRAAQLTGWLRADRHRPKRDRRTARFMFEAIRGEGYAGGYGRVSAFVRRWHEEQAAAPRGKAYVPLAFESGEAFQFDRSCEYAVIGGLRRRLEVAHVKLNSSRAFWLVAYPTQSHEMLFDAHARAFAAFGGVPRRAIYDNMKKRLVVGRGRRDELVGVRPAPRAVSINFHGSRPDDRRRRWYGPTRRLQPGPRRWPRARTVSSSRP